MSRRPVLYVEDMIEAAQRVIEFSGALDMAGFCADRKTRDATIRNLEVIGEAAKKVSEPVRALEPGIPWRRITGMRDVLAHDYFGVDDGILWDVVSIEVPALLPMLIVLRKRMETGEA